MGSMHRKTPKTFLRVQRPGPWPCCSACLPPVWMAPDPPPASGGPPAAAWAQVLGLLRAAAPGLPFSPHSPPSAPLPLPGPGPAAASRQPPRPPPPPPPLAGLLGPRAPPTHGRPRPCAGLSVTGARRHPSCCLRVPHPRPPSGPEPEKARAPGLPVRAPVTPLLRRVLSPGHGASPPLFQVTFSSLWAPQQPRGLRAARARVYIRFPLQGGAGQLGAGSARWAHQLRGR